MTIEALLSINSPALLFVTANSNLTMKDLVAAKKEAAGITNTLNYDFNNNGVVDEEDLSFIRRRILGKE